MRKLAIVLGVLFSSSAFAQSSGIPWTNGRVLTAPMMQQFDAAKINVNRINAANGVAGLDGNGNVTSPVVGDIDNGKMGALALSNYLTNENVGHYTVFLGTTVNFGAISSNVDKSLGTNRIGLYVHGTGAGNLTSAQRAAIQATWAKTGVDIVNGGGIGLDEISYYIDKGYANLFGGKLQQIAAVNMPATPGTYTETANDPNPGTTHGNYLTSDQEQTFETRFNTIATTYGANSVLPVIRWEPNYGGGSFSTGGYWGTWRTFVTFSGGSVLDTPPAWAVSRGTSYVRGIADQIKWLTDHHLAAVLMVSPWKLTGIQAKATTCEFQPDFLETTQEYVSLLRSYGAIPTQYVVENYCGDANNTTENNVTGDDDPESLNQVALWLASQPVSPTPSVQPAEANSKPFTQLLISPNIQASLTGPRTLSVLDNLNTPVVDLMNYVEMPIARPADMAYQSAASVHITGGTLGDPFYQDPLNFFVTSNSTFRSVGNTFFGNAVSDSSGNVTTTYGSIYFGPDNTYPSIFNYHGLDGIVVQPNLYVTGMVTVDGKPNETSIKQVPQGTIHTWNMSSGTAETDFINIAPNTATSGGFYFYNSIAGADPSTTSALLKLDGTSGATFNVPITVSNRITASKLVLTGISASAEIGDATSQNSFVDLHSSVSDNDYDARLYVYGGTPGTSGYGAMTITARGGITLDTGTALTVPYKLTIPYGTPTKGSSCASGQIEADDDNEYVCHASTWTYRPKGNAW